MEFLNILLPILLYIFGIVLLIVLIILGIRLIQLLNKIDKLTDDVSEKVNSLNGLFSIVDRATDAIAIMSDRIVGKIIDIIKRKRKEDNEYEEEQ